MIRQISVTHITSFKRLYPRILDQLITEKPKSVINYVEIILMNDCKRMFFFLFFITLVSETLSFIQLIFGEDNFSSRSISIKSEYRYNLYTLIADFMC